MSALRRFVLRLCNVFRPGRAEQELDREMAAHLALLEEDLQRRGLTREQAAIAAQRAVAVDRGGPPARLRPGHEACCPWVRTTMRA